MLSFLVWLIVIVGAIKVAYALLVPRLLTSPVEADQIHPVRTQDGWQIRLLRYHAHGEPGEPVLLVHGLAGSPLTFAPPGTDGLARQLAARGFDCWAIDLRGNRGTAPPSGTSRYGSRFDDYVRYDLAAAIEFIRESTGHNRVHWVGHSMGGLLFLSYAAWQGTSEMAAAVTLGTPLRFTPAGQRWHRRLRRSGLLRAISIAPGFSAWYQRMVAPLLPLLRTPTISGPVNWQNADPRIGPAAYYNMLELPPPGVLRKMSYFAAENWLRVRGNRIDVIESLKRLDVPLLMLTGAQDPLATPSATRTVVEQHAAESVAVHTLGKATGTADDYNHIDLIFGRNGDAEVAARIADWLRAHPADRREERPRPKRARKPRAARKAAPLEAPADTEERPAAVAEPEIERRASEPERTEPVPDPAAPEPDAELAVASKRWSAALEDAAGILDALGGGEAKPKRWPKKPAAKRKTAKQAAPEKSVAGGNPSKSKAKAKRKAAKPAKGKSGPKKASGKSSGRASKKRKS